MIFEVTPEHIEALSDTDLRTLVGYLAEQEVVRAGHSASNVTYGGHQNAKDGGIDVRVDLASGAIEGYIPRAHTGLQVRAEDMPKAAIQKEMGPGGKLRAAIIELGKMGGAYVIVSSKGSVSNTSLSARKKAMADAIESHLGVAGLHVDFYDRRRLATWVNQHHGLVPWVRSRVGQPLAGWRPFEDWSSSPRSTDEDYLTDDGVRLVGVSLKGSDGLKAADGLNKLRMILSQPKGVVRLVGLSGVGKTRMVQALFDATLGSDALSPRLAIYTDIADEPDPVPLELLSTLHSFGQRCVMIVDNCGVELHRKLASRINIANSLVSLITVEYDVSDDEPEHTDVFKLEPASKDVIEKIVERRHPNLTAPEIRTIAAFSEGNFRIALALADTAKNGESLANLRDSDLFKRLFRQKNEDDPALLRAAKVCALVYSFDGETTDGGEAELPIMAALAEQSVLELHRHIAELHRRQLVQKRAKWRALLPHALAQKLAKEALDDLPRDQLLKKLVYVAPERLLKSFSRRLGGLHDSKEAQAIVAEWLSDDGWISGVENLNALGMDILDNVAPVHPDAVLRSIQAAADRRADFFEMNGNSVKLVSLLRSLAYEAASFDQAVRLIVQFARSKTKSNNTSDAINVFKSLFFIILSGTHATAMQRAAFLRKLAADDRPECRAVVLAGLEATLECDHFSSSHGFEFGTRKRDYGFHPRTMKEQADWYAATLSLCADLAALPGFREDVRSMVASQFVSLARTAPVDHLIALTDKFSSDGGWPQGWGGVRRAAREAREAKQDEVVAKLDALESRLKPGSLAERIASYVLPPEWGALDVAEIDADDENKYTKARNQVAAICEGIGSELATDLDTLAMQLPVMLSSQSARVATVATSIGRETLDPRRAWEMIRKEVLASSHEGKVFTFPGAFLAGLSAKDPKLVEILLDEALTSEAMVPFLVHMQVCVGVDVRGCERLVIATKITTVPTYMFRHLSHGRASDALPGADFKRLLLAIADREDGLEAAIDILHMRVFSLTSAKKPIGAAEKETGLALLAKVPFEKESQADTHDLSEIAGACLTAPDDNDIVQQLCERMLEAVNQYRARAWDYSHLFTELAVLFPGIVLDVLVERSGSEDDRRRGVLGDFGERRPCPLNKIDDAFLLDWAHEKPDSRFVQLAEVITAWKGVRGGCRPEADDEAGPLDWTPAAKRLMHEAPEPVAILQKFSQRFYPSSWSGSRADILASRIPLLEQLRNDPDQRISQWAMEATPLFQEKVDRCRESEAKDDRVRDERFEW